MDGMVLANIYITLDSAISKTFNMFLNKLQMMFSGDGLKTILLIPSNFSSIAFHGTMKVVYKLYLRRGAMLNIQIYH